MIVENGPDDPASTSPGVMDRLGVAILMTDADGTIIYANRNAAALLAPAKPLHKPLLETLRLWSSDTCPATEEIGSHGERTRLLGRDGTVLEYVAQRAGVGLLVELTDVTHHVRAAAAAACDPLTGLADRNMFRDRLNDHLAARSRSGSPLAVLYIDLDRFKAINDTLGHQIGDLLLAKVADRLRRAARESDLIARLGGDEFAVIQIGADRPQSIEVLAGRLVDLIGRTYIVEGHMLNIGASIGVAIAGDDGADGDTLLKNADLALYRAKTDGRGVYRFFQPEMNTRMQHRRFIEMELRRALALRQFELAYQPQVKADSGEIIGFEALLRWDHPDRGLISPADFIPLAEEIGLIVPIGEWVIRTACMHAATWARPVSIAVNLSPVQFRGGKLVEMVTAALAQSGLPPERLELEITEGALLDNTDAVVTTLRALGALGIRISMDDFGTGYSSLSYLQKFPFSKIKIDRSFVRGLDSDADCGAIVRAVAGLGSSLGMRTTAEGVETSEQLELVKAFGCTEVQGFYTGRPMPATAAAALLLPRSAPKGDEA